MSRRVLVAMSGGVDSSVAAALLCEQGYEVVGVAMRLAPDAPAQTGKRRGTCCSHDDFEDARRVSERMGFPFYVVDLRADFGARVIGNFVSEYLAGRTPNPCVMCNREIKFDRLWSRARALEADFIATGHYARISRDDGWPLSFAARRGLLKGPVLLSVYPRPSRTVAHAVSAWRDDQGRSSSACASARPRQCRQAREPGNLFRSRRRLCAVRRAPCARRIRFGRDISPIAREMFSPNMREFIALPSASGEAWESPQANLCMSVRYGTTAAMSSSGVVPG